MTSERDKAVIMAAAGWGEAEAAARYDMGGLVLLLFTWLLIGVLSALAWQALVELLVSRPRWSLRQLIAFTFGVGLATWLCILIYS